MYGNPCNSFEFILGLKSDGCTHSKSVRTQLLKCLYVSKDACSCTGVEACNAYNIFHFCSHSSLMTLNFSTGSLAFQMLPSTATPLKPSSRAVAILSSSTPPIAITSKVVSFKISLSESSLNVLLYPTLEMLSKTGLRNT